MLTSYVRSGLTFMFVSLQDGSGGFVATIVVTVDVFVEVVTRDWPDRLVRRVDVEAGADQLLVVHKHRKSALVPAEPLEEAGFDVQLPLQTETLHDARRSLEAAQRW